MALTSIILAVAVVVLVVKWLAADAARDELADKAERLEREAKRAASDRQAAERRERVQRSFGQIYN